MAAEDRQFLGTVERRYQHRPHPRRCDVRANCHSSQHNELKVLSRLSRLFTRHPASVGETYFQHMLSASGFAAKMVIGGVACLVHAILPFLFVSTGSRFVVDLHERMIATRGTRA